MITFITGENYFGIKSSVDKLKAEFVKANGEGGLERYDAAELELAKLPDLITGSSLFSAKRMVIVRDIGANKDLAEAIASQAGSVDKDTALVLTQAEPDKRTKWYKALSRYSKTMANPRGAQLVSWLVEQAKARKIKLGPAAATHLIRVAGEDQWRLAGELDKLAAHGGEINNQTIDKLVEPTSDETIFKLIDTTVQGNTDKALKMYDRLRLGEIDPHQFVGTLSWQLDALVTLKTNQTKPSGQIASISGLSPYVIDRIRPMSSKLSLAQIKKMIKMTLNADWDMKQTGIDADQRAKLLIAQLGEATAS